MWGESTSNPIEDIKREIKRLGEARPFPPTFTVPIIEDGKLVEVRLMTQEQLMSHLEKK